MSAMSENSLPPAENDVRDWRETALKFSDDYHAELSRRIEAEQTLIRVRGLLWEWESSQGDLGNDTFPIRNAARELREVLGEVRVLPPDETDETRGLDPESRHR